MLNRLLGKKPDKPAKPNTGSTGTFIRISNIWHAVSVDHGKTGCAAAQKLGETRFLSPDAPKLPLAGCTNPMGCQCRYKHHDDRRNNQRRNFMAANALRSIGGFPGNDRRFLRGRRASDGG
jgi:hypothetical protein